MSLLYKPDFIVAGPAKTGTTWLYQQLKHVDGFKPPPVKELSFFSDVSRDFILQPENKYLLEQYGMNGIHITSDLVRRYKEQRKARGSKNRRQAFEANRYLWGLYFSAIPRNTSLLSFRCYAKLFAQQTNIASGDISPTYFNLAPPIISLIAERYPKLKIVFIIRDPVEREWSNIRMTYFSNRARSAFSIQSYLQTYLPTSDYKFNLENWETYFDKSRISYLFYDDLKNNPQKFIDSFISIIKPNATVTKLIAEPVGKGIDKQFDSEIKAALVKKNLPQYEFLAQKFGPYSYPATWKEQALAYLDKNL